MCLLEEINIRNNIRYFFSSVCTRACVRMCVHACMSVFKLIKILNPKEENRKIANNLVNLCIYILNIKVSLFPLNSKSSAIISRGEILPFFSFGPVSCRFFFCILAGFRRHTRRFFQFSLVGEIGARDQKSSQNFCLLERETPRRFLLLPR